VKRGPPSVGDYALVRRQFAVFERALKKFGADVALWVAYIRKAQDEGARALIGRLCARCVPLVPRAHRAALMGRARRCSGTRASSRCMCSRRCTSSARMRAASRLCRRCSSAACA
jgi:hypothetical protein